MRTQFLATLFEWDRSGEGRMPIYDYLRVRKWTAKKRGARNLDMIPGSTIFDYDSIVIPLHLELHNHWAILFVDLENKAIHFFDSSYARAGHGDRNRVGSERRKGRGGR